MIPPPMYTVKLGLQQTYVYVIGDFSFRFVFFYFLRPSDFIFIFLLIFPKIFSFLMKCFPLLCTVSIRSRFSDIRRSWLRIVTDIIFCIHGISLLNKIKDQNLEFEEKNTRKKKPSQHMTVYIPPASEGIFLPSLPSYLPRSYTYIFYSTKAQPWREELSRHYTFNISGASAASEM